ncbi:helix-turn-helix domain-containing protein [Aestuariicoccus sp. MJ-SS9]|uniref:helix-turn-helix domain-containing protein n=1 Tax=Aestuariicoccus sp. MJ-SS9 TaxID=3079855 RepID=UPI00290D4761|nr:helix-turn-helix domain-containing protein [Aestuariicoccus sp. MJ-SS9]MDU8912452.1 helix-turn-helix domain-containing protein [Aestuariicoccus sp. MJ-SS9]
MYVTIPTDHYAPSYHFKPRVSRGKSTEVSFKAGAYLYFEGDAVERLYEVKSGVLRLTRLLEDGRRQVISFGYPGDIVGFPASGLHHTDCDVLVDARLQPYSRAALESGANDPQLHQDLLEAALREISAMQDHFLMLGRKSAAEKVASFLSVLAERVGDDMGNYRKISLPMSRADIADFLGLTTETVSRSLTQLRKAKVIAIENIHTVIILRPQALLALSDGHQDMVA